MADVILENEGFKITYQTEHIKIEHKERGTVIEIAYDHGDAVVISALGFEDFSAAELAEDGFCPG